MDRLIIVSQIQKLDSVITTTPDDRLLVDSKKGLGNFVVIIKFRFANISKMAAQKREETVNLQFPKNRRAKY